MGGSLKHFAFLVCDFVSIDQEGLLNPKWRRMIVIGICAML
jgi:hypothetical protein